MTITDRLDQLGVHYIEEGRPGSNPKNAEFFERAKSFKLKNSVLTGFESTRRANVDAANDPQIQTLLKAETDVVTLAGKN